MLEAGDKIYGLRRFYTDSDTKGCEVFNSSPGKNPKERKIKRIDDNEMETTNGEVYFIDTITFLRAGVDNEVKRMSKECLILGCLHISTNGEKERTGEASSFIAFSITLQSLRNFINYENTHTIRLLNALSDKCSSQL